MDAERDQWRVNDGISEGWSQPHVAAHAWYLNILEAEAGGLLIVSGHAGLHNESQASLGYSVRPCHKNKKMRKSNLLFYHLTMIFLV